MLHETKGKCTGKNYIFIHSSRDYTQVAKHCQSQSPLKMKKNPQVDCHLVNHKSIVRYNGFLYC